MRMPHTLSQRKNSPATMKGVLTLFLVLLCSPAAWAQGVDPLCWVSVLDDTIPVSRLSVPGAHDAATGEGVYMVTGLGKTQALSLSELWDCGVRAFDLRPAVDDGRLHIYHGPVKTRISFDEALDVICGKLDACPGEFAIVLLREESDSESAGEHAMWADAVGDAISALGERAACFSPGMTVGELRGKILFLSRSSYSGCDRGAYITGWSHSADGTESGCIVPYCGGSAARLSVQDYYNVSGSGRRTLKDAAVVRFLSLAAVACEGCWTINFLSGYSSTWLGFTPFATSAGYKRNAGHVNGLVLEILSSRTDAVPTGIIFMDYAGTDSACGGIFHWGRFRTHGKTLVQRIIESNSRRVH